MTTLHCFLIRYIFQLFSAIYYIKVLSFTFAYAYLYSIVVMMKFRRLLCAEHLPNTGETINIFKILVRIIYWKIFTLDAQLELEFCQKAGSGITGVKPLDSYNIVLVCLFKKYILEISNLMLSSFKINHILQG